MKIITGTILDWNEEKGFGFISTNSGNKKIFFHINDYSQKHKRPIQNLKVQYSVSRDKKGRTCAIAVKPIQGHKIDDFKTNQKLNSLYIIGVFSAVLFFLYLFNKVPVQILWLYIAMSIFTFLMYVKDKNAAQCGEWRTSESALHFLSLFGGWPGAKIAQSFLRHKSKKLSFRITYWVTVCLNCAVLYWLTTPEGSMWLKTELNKIKIG